MLRQDEAGYLLASKSAPLAVVAVQTRAERRLDNTPTLMHHSARRNYAHVRACLRRSS